MMKWFFGLGEVAAAVATETTGTVNTYAEMSLLSKGLITTALGLAGVFLVLTMFFVTIRLMSGIKTKTDETQN